MKLNVAMAMSANQPRRSHGIAVTNVLYVISYASYGKHVCMTGSAPTPRNAVTTRSSKSHKINHLIEKESKRTGRPAPTPVSLALRAPLRGAGGGCGGRRRYIEQYVGRTFDEARVKEEDKGMAGVGAEKGRY